ncbi:TPA: ammonia monooxygenase [Yersinia enterocolitica]
MEQQTNSKAAANAREIILNQQIQKISAVVVDEQRALVAQLIQLGFEEMPEYDLAELVCGTLTLLAKNVVNEVTDWERAKPLVSWDIAKYWLQARIISHRIYGELGVNAWNYARESLATDLAFEKAMYRLDRDDE